MSHPTELVATEEQAEGLSSLRRNHPANWPAGVDVVMGTDTAGKDRIHSVRLAKGRYTEASAETWIRAHVPGVFKVRETAGKASSSPESPYTHLFEVAKGGVVEDERLFFAWGYVSKDVNNQIVPPERTLEDGTVVDFSGEVVDIDDIEKSIYSYVEHSREGDVDHDGPVAATLVESMVFTPAKKRVLGLPDDYPEGVVLGFRVHDDDAWSKVKSGKLKMLSLAGGCTREDY